MTLLKRIASAALCLCLGLSLLYIAAPMKAKAVTALSSPSLAFGAPYRSCWNPGKDITSMGVGAYKQGTPTVVKTETEISNGKRINFKTDLDKNYEYVYYPFTTTLIVPAHTTCTLDQTFTLNSAKQITSSTAAAAAAGFEVLYFGEEPAPDNTVIKLATKNTSSSSDYGSDHGQALLRGYRKGKSTKNDDGKTRYIDTDAVKSNVVKCTYKNDSSYNKNVSLNFGFWACTQYATTYKNSFDITFDVVFGEITAEELVTLEPNGAALSNTTRLVTYGKTYGTLPTLSKYGYDFDGWYTVELGGTRVTATTTVSIYGAHTLYARWTPKKSTVTFDARGGSLSTKTKTVAYSEEYGELPVPTRDNYTFGGWFTGINGGGTKITSDTVVKITANQTLYAMWTLKKFTVTFDAGKGSLSTKTKTVTYSEKYGELPVPTRDDYTFGGWFTESYGKGTEITSDTVVDITEDQTLYAYWVGQPSPNWRSSVSIPYGQRSVTLFSLSLSRESYDYTYELYQCDDINGTNARFVDSTSITIEEWGRNLQVPENLIVGKKYYFYAKVTHTQTDAPYKSATVTGPVTELTVEKATPKPSDFPTAQIELTVSPRLGDHSLVGGSMINPYNDAAVPGTFNWENGDEILTETDSYGSKYVIFTPDDQSNYTTARFRTNVIIRCQHNYVDTGEVTTAATCTTSGYMRQICSLCSKTSKRVIPALGHDYENSTWQITVTQHYKKCLRCDATDTPADHTFGEWSGGKRACSECGYEETEIVSITVIWSDMTYTYTDGDWDPETHDYALGEWTTDGNLISVENQGNNKVTVSFDYSQENGNVYGQFTDENGTAVISSVSIPVSGKKKARLLLSGKPKQNLTNETVGKITVCIE